MNTLPRRARQLQKIGSFIAQVNDNAAAYPCAGRSFPAKHPPERAVDCAFAFAND
jgi:hypothetical protein